MKDTKMSKEKIMNVGADLHKSQITNCYLNQDGNEKIKQYFFSKNGYEDLKKDLLMFREKGYYIRLAVETTGNTEYFHKQVKDYIDEVKIINTKKAKDLLKSRKKTDENDSRAIAFLLSRGIFEKQYIVDFASQDAKNLRRLLKSRSIIVRSRTALKNQIHGILLGNGEETKKRFLNSKKGIDELKKMHYAEQEILNALLTCLEEHIKQIMLLEEKIKKYIDTKKDMYRVISSIPGFGIISSASLAAGIDTIKRFEKKEQLSAYCGLVPSIHNSGEKIAHGRITKEGPNYMRAALVQGVLAMIRDKSMQEHHLVKRYYKLKKTHSAGKAIIATARKVLTIIWTLLQKNEEFDICRYANDRLLLGSV
jgi:transposase